jgi:hypothetical protein
MKHLLQISLVVNLVLVMAALWRNVHRAPVSPSPLSSEVRETAGASIKSPTSSNTDARVAKSKWREIDSRDPRQLIANLRAIGCPEKTIRDIVALRVCRQIRERFLAAESDDWRAWDYTRNRTQADIDESNRRQQDLRNEMVATIESLFGDSWESLMTRLVGFPQSSDDFMASLSVDKRRQVRELETRYSRLDGQIQRDSMQSRGNDPEAPSRQRELEKQKQAELAAILSPQELQEYLYHRSAAARYVRENGPEAKSEAEFRTMVDVAAETGMTRPPLWASMPLDPSDPNNATMQAYNEQKAAFEQRLKEALGDQRIAEQKAADQARVDQEQKQRQEQDLQHQRARVLETTSSLGIPAENANQFVDRLVESQKTLKPKFDELEKSLTGTPEEKKKQMEAAIKAELQKIAVETMGEKGRAVVDKMIQSGQ